MATVDKSCRVCGARSNLRKDSRKPGGLDTICKACTRERNCVANYTPEQIRIRRESRLRYEAKNPEIVKTRKHKASKNRTPDPVRVQVGQAVKAWRLANKVKANELQALLGVKQSTWASREAGLYPWPLDHLQKLRRAGAAIPDPIPPVAFQRLRKNLRVEA